MHRQRGAISIIAAATLVVAVLVVALALDIGRIILEKQRLQSAADAAALAGARTLAAEGNSGTVAVAAQAAAVKNGYTGNLTIDVGHLVRTGGLRSFVSGPGSAPPTYHAVQITATHSVPRSLVAGGLLPGEVALTARAVAEQVNTATISVGTALLRVDTSREATLLNAVLGSMLDTRLALGVLDYKALVGANVELGELAAALQLGSVDNLLHEEITLNELVSESVTILQGKKDDESARLAAIALNDHLLNLPGNIRLGDVLGLATDSAGAEAKVNVAELIMASAQVANYDPQNPAAIKIDLEDALSQLGLPDTLNLHVNLTVVQPPTIKVGPPGPPGCAPADCNTMAESAQLRLGIGASILGLISLDIGVDGAAATAWLEAVERPTPSSPVHVRVRAESDAARVKLTGAISVNTIFGKQDIPLLGINTSVGGGEYEPTFIGPFPSETSDGSGSRSSGFNELQLSVSLGLLDKLGITRLVNGLLSSLTSSLLSPLIENLLSPLTKLLGLQIADADVTVLHASTGQVRLVQ